MTVTLFQEALQAAEPLLEIGYVVLGQQMEDSGFGSGWVMLCKGDGRVRIVNDRGQWFVEIGSEAAPEEWFDSRLVLAEIGRPIASVSPDRVELAKLCQSLARNAAQWEVLFLKTTFTIARTILRAREALSARERFGV